jgi:hypothetical protein
MNTTTLVSSDEAASAADTLIQESSPFSLEPLPDDEWRLDYRPHLRRNLEARLGRELLPTRRTGRDA